MKKLLAILLCLVMVLGIVACGAKDKTDDGEKDTAKAKFGIILIGDENEGYSAAHINGIKKAMETLKIDAKDVIWKYTVPEDAQCKDAIDELIAEECTHIFSNSYNHQNYMKPAAEEHSDIQFVSLTGDTAAASGLANLSNAFNATYESRYVSGVVAGMKIAELIKDGKLTDANYDADGNVKIGYVGAFPFAEVVSGYTGFFLGIKSVVENVSMEVAYTESWFDMTKEGAAAEAFGAKGCVIVGQHADSTGAPSKVEEMNKKGQVIYSVGYNIDMLGVAPTAALTSATNDWSVYYTYAMGAALNGEKIVTNWSKGYSDGAVGVTKLGPGAAEGTADKVAEVESKIKDGTLKVFDTDTFTVGGAKLESFMADVIPDAAFTGDTEAIKDGYFHESEFRSAPYFSVRIDGITELTN